MGVRMPHGRVRGMIIPYALLRRQCFCMRTGTVPKTNGPDGPFAAPLNSDARWTARSNRQVGALRCLNHSGGGWTDQWERVDGPRPVGSCQETGAVWGAESFVANCGAGNCWFFFLKFQMVVKVIPERERNLVVQSATTFHPVP